jgi:hypothetical protein
MHFTVDLSLDLITSRPFVHKPEDLPVGPENTSRLDDSEPPLTLPSTLIQDPIEKAFRVRRKIDYID